MSKYTPEVYEEAFRLHNLGEFWNDIARKLSAEYGWKVNPDTLRKAFKVSGQEVSTLKETTVEEHIQATRDKRSESETKRLNRELVNVVEKLQEELTMVKNIKQTPQAYKIKPLAAKKMSATQVIVWSDWHCEEPVKPETVNHLNEFNLEIADKRIQNCIRNSARLLDITSRDIEIDQVVLFLGGDFITGGIHPELMEVTLLDDGHAIRWVQARIKAGIEYLLSKTDKKIVVICHSGNHARTTHDQRNGTEAGHSWEYIMYHWLSDLFPNEPRLEWIIAEGYHTYLDLYGKTIRFHHGHAIRYGGGVGGIFIPAFKAISQWNKGRHADLDVFGHFHQLKNGGSFIVNGSLIGYNAYALSIKAEFERPYQKFFMFSKTGEVIAEHPIFLE